MVVGLDRNNGNRFGRTNEVIMLLPFGLKDGKFYDVSEVKRGILVLTVSRRW
ncbi:hypothetical protein IFVP69_C1150060 [Vibrio parahaemolyticus]